MHPIKFQPVEKLLRNNQPITIRHCSPDDAEAITKTIKLYLSDSEHLPLSADEYNPSLEQNKLWINSFLQYNNSLLLVACHYGKIIGNIDITGNQRRALQHTGVVGMGILKEWRNIGLGTAMLHAAIDWAKHNPMLEKLWLQVFFNNTAGIALYKNAGFVVDGVQHNFIKTPDNNYIDNVIMSLSVS